MSALGEPTRRRLYDYVVQADEWVSRDAAAEGAGLERATSAHHLDRLVADGLLEVDYQRLSGRTGPGAGRPAKVYRRADRDISVALPPRDYRLAAELLARAVDRGRSDGVPVQDAVDSVAAEQGRQWGELIRSRLHGSESRKTAARQAAIVALLAEQGYEPDVVDDGSVSLRNCPFDDLADRHTDLVCGMNHCLLDATVAQVGRSGLRASLEPTDGRCCVTFRTK